MSGKSVGRRWFLLGGLLVALLLAGVVSQFASSSPDGLDKTARDGCTFNAEGEITGGTCMAQQEQEHQLADSPLADYSIRGIDNEGLATGLSGVLGVLITFGVGAGAFWLVRRRNGDGGAATGDSARGNGTGDSAGRNSTGRNSTGRNSAGRDSTGRDTVGRDTVGT